MAEDLSAPLGRKRAAAKPAATRGVNLAPTSLPLARIAFGVAVAGTNAFIADNSSGLQVADISNPASPVIVGNVDTQGSAHGVAVVGGLTYIADNSAGLQILLMRCSIKCRHVQRVKAT